MKWNFGELIALAEIDFNYRHGQVRRGSGPSGGAARTCRS